MPSSDPSRKPLVRTLLKSTAVLGAIALVGVLAYAGYISSLVPRLFKLNKACQEEGYYMAEFEFKMLGFAYLLDRGEFARSASGIRQLIGKLEAREGLVKVPKFTSRSQELEFYLNLQNPRTGAFMDDASPYCTWDGPTQNVLLHIEGLAQATGQPVRLKHRLKYLDEINTPAKLKAQLDDMSHVGWVAARFPATSFVFARELLGYAGADSVLERNNLYAFSPEWKRAMLAWFHEFQDPETGLWGPRSRRTGKLMSLDVDNTASIMKAFVDREGNDRHPEFPMRYKPQLFATALKVMSRPQPAAGREDEWHAWTLTMGKGVDMLTRHLWKDASAENHAAARRLFESYVRARFARYFVAADGAFSYYPDSGKATLDGTSGGVGVYFGMGAYSAERRKRLWGGAETTCANLGVNKTASLTERDLAPVTAKPEVNSVRYYSGDPDEDALATAANGVFYPRATAVVDAVELAPRVSRWLESTGQSMGNWVSRQELIDRLAEAGVKPVPVYQTIPVEAINGVLGVGGSVTLVGFDVLQVPRYRLAYRAR